MKNRSLHQIMRALHRDVGFFVFGITIIYSLSGIVLIYRDKGLLTHNKRIQETIDTKLGSKDLAKFLHIKNLHVKTENEEFIKFKNGIYYKLTGDINYVKEELYWPFNKFINLHKSVSKNATHIFALLYGLALLFLAISSFWMFKPSTSLFRRGILLSLLGIVFVIIILIFF